MPGSTLLARNSVVKQDQVLVWSFNFVEAVSMDLDKDKWLE